MAKAIHQIAPKVVTPEEEREQALVRIQKVMTDNEVAVSEFIQWIRVLHDSGLLGMARAFLEQGEKVMEIIVNQAKQPDTAGGIKNAMELAAMLGDLDVPMIRQMLGAVSEATARARAGETAASGGVFRMLGALRDPDIAAGMGLMLEVMRGLGKGIRSGQ